jgi:hypothetical protein
LQETKRPKKAVAEQRIAVSDNVIYSVTSLTVLVDVATLLLDAAHDDADALILIVANILSLSAPDIVP